VPSAASMGIPPRTQIAVLIPYHETTGRAIPRFLDGDLPRPGVSRLLHQFPDTAGVVAKAGMGAEEPRISQVKTGTREYFRLLPVIRPARRFVAIKFNTHVRKITERFVPGLPATAQSITIRVRVFFSGPPFVSNPVNVADYDHFP
jgi:hypothetical protein